MLFQRPPFSEIVLIVLNKTLSQKSQRSNLVKPFTSNEYTVDLFTHTAQSTLFQ